MICPAEGLSDMIEPCVILDCTFVSDVIEPVSGLASSRNRLNVVNSSFNILECSLTFIHGTGKLVN
jgi:hypothetical protein